MIPVDQQNLSAGNGDCFSACIASLLELPLEAVPNFCREGQDADGSTWLQRAGDWLRSQGWGFVNIEWGQTQNFLIPSDCWLIAMGSTMRAAERHAIVVRANAGRPENEEGKSVWSYSLEVVHDPHPSRAGLEILDALLFLVPVAT